jgi:ferredoxin-thioredoxin reductase catalytic subunit
MAGINDGKAFETSKLHPSIKEKIIFHLEQMELSWEYLLKDNFFSLAAELSTPVSVTLNCIDQLVLSEMCLSPARQLEALFQIYYEQKRDEGEDVPACFQKPCELCIYQPGCDRASFNSHELENFCLDHGSECYYCFKSKHQFFEKRHLWGKIQEAEAKHGVELPCWEYASKLMAGQVPADDLHGEDGYDSDGFLIENTFNVRVCPQAKHEIDGLLFGKEPGSQTAVDWARVELLAKGMSELETEQTAQINAQQLYFHKQRFYKIREDRLAEKQQREKQQLEAEVAGAGTRRYGTTQCTCRRAHSKTNVDISFWCVCSCSAVQVEQE